MAVREIIKLPDIRLRLVSEPVKRIDAGIRKLVEDMFATMYAAPGIGLAAIQVGIGKRGAGGEDGENRNDRWALGHGCLYAIRRGARRPAATVGTKQEHV